MQQTKKPLPFINGTRHVDTRESIVQFAREPDDGNELTRIHSQWQAIRTTAPAAAGIRRSTLIVSVYGEPSCVVVYTYTCLLRCMYSVPSAPYTPTRNCKLDRILSSVDRGLLRRCHRYGRGPDREYGSG